MLHSSLAAGHLLRGLQLQVERLRIHIAGCITVRDILFQ
jgi:hypothetical protein